MGRPLQWLGGCSTLWLSSERMIAACSQWLRHWRGSWSDGCALMFWQLVWGTDLCWLLPCRGGFYIAWLVADVVFWLLAVANLGVAASHSHLICCGNDATRTLQLFFAPFQSCKCFLWCVGPILWWHIPVLVWQAFGMLLSLAWGSWSGHFSVENAGSCWLWL